MKHAESLTLNTKFSSDCKFCDLLSESIEAEQWNRPWLRSNHYSALVSLGALTPGWSLICPNEHKLNLSSDYIREDFWALVGRATRHLKSAYGKSIQCFEHGSNSVKSLTGCGVDHAHLHLVPLDMNLHREAALFEPSLQWQKCKPSEIGDLVEESEYLYVISNIANPEPEGYLALLAEQRSQFFRRVIARKLGLPLQFDYKHYPMIDTVRATAATLINRMGPSCSFEEPTPDSRTDQACQVGQMSYE